jgi:flagellar motor switch protein FliM
MRLSDVVDLKPGQRIVLNASVGAAVQIRCGTVHLFDGHVGRRKNRVAVKLDTNMKRVSTGGIV